MITLSSHGGIFLKVGQGTIQEDSSKGEAECYFCILCKTRIQQVKLHKSKLQTFKNAPCKKLKISAPSAVILRGLRKLAAYHCHVQIFMTYSKVTNKLKFGFFEELFYGNPVKNIKGACQQVIDGDHTFAHLYHKYKGEDGVDLTLKLSCCGIITPANHIAGVHFTTAHIYTYATGKRFSGRSVWLMADSILTLIKKALLLVPKLSPKIVNIDSGLKVIRYARGQNKASFFQAIDNGMCDMERREGCGLDPNDDSRKTGILNDADDGTDKEGAIDMVVVEETPLLTTSWNPFNGVYAPVGYTATLLWVSWR
jgi:hypothetical protein